MMIRRYCEFCGNIFDTPNPRRVFCSTRCRRDADNERKQERRSDEAELRDEYMMPDVWTENRLPYAITENTLLDGWTGRCEADFGQGVQVVLSCPMCPHWRSRHGRKISIDLLCEMCRSGSRV